MNFNLACETPTEHDISIWYFRYDIGANTISDILETDTASLNEEEVQKMNENVLDVIDKFANAGDVVAYKEAVATDK